MSDEANRGITCQSYERSGEGRRCVHYRDGGLCARAGRAQTACVEWVRVNGEALPPQVKTCEAVSAEPVVRDLFGNAIPAELPRRGSGKEPAPRATGQVAASASAPAPAPAARPPRLPVVRNVTDEEVASFKALGVEVCIQSAEVGEVWVVPEYTGAERRELSVEHSITLATICAAFPGAKVVSMTSRAAMDAEERR